MYSSAPIRNLLSSAFNQQNLGSLIAGTAISEVTDNGFNLKKSLFKLALQDTRTYHLWILSAGNDPVKLGVRLLQYSALETVGLSFGHLSSYSVALTVAALRHNIAKNLVKDIVPENVPLVLSVEAKIQASAEFVQKHGIQAYNVTGRFIPEVVAQIPPSGSQSYLNEGVEKGPIIMENIRLQNIQTRLAYASKAPAGILLNFTQLLLKN